MNGKHSYPLKKTDFDTVIECFWLLPYLTRFWIASPKDSMSPLGINYTLHVASTLAAITQYTFQCLVQCLVRGWNTAAKLII